MTMDRDYIYLAKTFDAPQLPVAAFVERMRSTALPVWRHLLEQGAIVSVQSFEKIGDIDLQTSPAGVRDWRYFVAVELEPGESIELVHDAERRAGLDVEQLARLGIQYLSNEVTVRPTGAGTAIPMPSPHWPVPPPNHSAGVEYIQIPARFWEEYRDFMRTVMGPVGARLVEQGDSFQIQIMECRQVLHRDPTLPPWNRIHVLWGDFDDPGAGFIERTSKVVRSMISPDSDVHATLGATNHYRIKPRMSKNQLLKPLCLGRYAGKDATQPAPRVR